MQLVRRELMSGIRMGMDITTRMDQKLILAPRMIQSMEILQLPIVDLLAKIEDEMQKNPCLERKDHGKRDDERTEEVEVFRHVPLAEIAQAFDEPVTAEQVEDTLVHIVQKLDPPGVGARDLKECLLLQITPETLCSEALRVLIR